VVRDERSHAELPAGAPDIPVLTWNGGDPVSSYADIAGKHEQVALAPKDPVRLMVFRNNVGLVSFAVEGSDYRVSHTLLSTADDDTGGEFTRHSVPFATSPLPAAPSSPPSDGRDERRGTSSRRSRRSSRTSSVGRGHLLTRARRGDARGSGPQRRQPGDPEGGRPAVRQKIDDFSPRRTSTRSPSRPPSSRSRRSPTRSSRSPMR
jgi:hypothetical protein